MSENFSSRYGPWALIAGASEGTGASFAWQLAARGINLILISRRATKLAALADELRRYHDIGCITASVDLTAPDAVDRIVAATGDREVGLFIYNAGADTNGSLFLNTEVNKWCDLAMLNVMTVIRACHHFGLRMCQRRRGGIILVGSAAAYSAVPKLAVYAATKAFEMTLGEGLWGEFKNHEVDVLNLMMVSTDTPTHRAMAARRGLKVGSDCASADEVAALGLERLPYGPFTNWGLGDDEAGYAGISAAARREQVVARGAALAARHAAPTQEAYAKP